VRKLVDTEEAAKILGITARAVRKKFTKGKIEGEFVAGARGGRSGQVLKVYVDEDSREPGILSSKKEKSDPQSPAPSKPVYDRKSASTLVTMRDVEEVRRRLKSQSAERMAHSEEQIVSTPPSENIGASPPPIIPPPDGGASSNQTGCLKGSGISAPTIRANRGCEPPALEQRDGRECVASTGPTPQHIESVVEVPEGPAGQCAPATCGIHLPAIRDKGPSSRSLRIANLRFALIQAFNQETSKDHKPKGQIVTDFVSLYNDGLILPKIRTDLKKISRSSLYTWLKLYDQGGVEALAPQWHGMESSSISEAEKKFLLTKLLDQNKPTIGDTINKCKFLLGDFSPSHPSRLRRWVKEFRRNNFDLWTLEREGEKALNDKCVPYAEREWRDLQVGEAVVADGHKLNFHVINPFTGKPCRATMVLFWDWKSAYPLGWEIMLTESIQCVVAALRNAIITLGKFPKHALLDNGKAFRANIFRKNFRFQETEIPGIFDKLGITAHFAMPYNAQSKPIERFFRTFNDWFERELPSYTGASIADKPARMSRNEKRARGLHNGWVPTIPEAMEHIFQWREYYADQPLKGRDGQRPRDLFEAGKGPGVDPFALHFMMMTCKARMVHRNGITFNGWHWYDSNLYGLKDYVIMFYSYYDLSQVYIFTTKNDEEANEFLCVARPVEKVKPFAQDSELPEDMAAVRQINATKNKAINTTKKLANMLQSEKQLYIDWDRKFRDRPEVAEAIKQIEDKKPKVVKLKPWLDEPAQNVPALVATEAEQMASPNSHRPRFKYDFEKYDWLMAQESITLGDLGWIREYRGNSSLYKHTVFTDWHELDRKVAGGQ
jgi:putative transposase